MSAVAFNNPIDRAGGTQLLGQTPAFAGVPAEKIGDDFETGMRRPIVIGSVIFGVFVVGLGLLATFAPLGAAIVATAVVKVEDNRKVVKHRDGGIIAQVLVRDGQKVHEGDVLVRMDDVQARSAFKAYDQQYMNLIARRARFYAEGMGADRVYYPQILLERKNEPGIAQLMADQTTLFETRRQALENQRSILKQQVAQLDTRIQGYEAQKTSITRQNDLIGQELVGTRYLADRDLSPKTKVLALERSAAGLTGQMGSLQSQIAEAQQAQGETRLKINELQDNRRTEGSQGISDIQAELASTLPRLESAKATLQLTEVRAPASGTVFGLTQFTNGGVIAPGEQILEIVPENSAMIVAANIQPGDIADLEQGMKAEVKLTAYNQHTTPSVDGEIVRISADRFTTQEGMSYYTAEVRIDPESLARSARELRLYPGMPAQVTIPTSNRTALDYLISPITDSMDRAFRER
jgi:HlyD family type I secretion membrane fusion protein